MRKYPRFPRLPPKYGVRVNTTPEYTAITDKLNLKNLALRPSRPVALEGSSESNCFCTKDIETGGVEVFQK